MSKIKINKQIILMKLQKKYKKKKKLIFNKINNLDLK